MKNVLKKMFVAVLLCLMQTTLHSRHVQGKDC